MVRSFTDSGWSAATQVKVVQPRNLYSQEGQGLLCLEASIVTGAIRRACHGVPGSRTAAGHPTDRVGTRSAALRAGFGRAVSLACPNEPRRQGGAREIRKSDRLIVEA